MTNSELLEKYALELCERLNTEYHKEYESDFDDDGNKSPYRNSEKDFKLVKEEGNQYWKITENILQSEGRNDSGGDEIKDGVYVVAYIDSETGHLHGVVHQGADRDDGSEYYEFAKEKNPYLKGQKEGERNTVIAYNLLDDWLRKKCFRCLDEECKTFNYLPWKKLPPNYQVVDNCDEDEEYQPPDTEYVRKQREAAEEMMKIRFTNCINQIDRDGGLIDKERYWRDIVDPKIKEKYLNK